MLYAILCYNDEKVVGSRSKEQDDAVIAKRAVVSQELAARGKLAPVARLMPTTAAVKAARPQPMGALLRYFRDLDRAIALAHTPAEAAHIRSRLDRLIGHDRIT
ncbi:MAG: YciI family protein [Alphaproteobacteria bacterium]|nr:YciI family protein [Alphaproteobacteria bacterium]